MALQLAEKGKSFVDIQGLTAATMEILLDFVYTETVLVTVENVQELLPAACLLQLKGWCTCCSKCQDSTLFYEFKFKTNSKFLVKMASVNFLMVFDCQTLLDIRLSL